jgi:hypothetical protein
MRALTKLLLRLTAIAILVVPVGTALALAAGWLFGGINDLRDRIEQQRTVAGRLALATSGNDASVDKRVDPGVGASLFIAGASEAIRSSALQSHLTELAAKEGLKLRSVRTLPTREKPEIRLLGAQVQFQAQLDKLQALLVAIENSRPALLITTLQLSPAVMVRMPGTENPGIVEARLDIFAVEAR